MRSALFALNCGSILWVAAASTVNLSLAYPIASAAYIVVFPASWLILGEQISPLRAAGLAVIVMGVVITPRS